MLLRSGDLAGFARRLWRRLVALLSALGRLGGPIGHVQWRERWVDLTDGEREVVAGWASATRFAVVVGDGPPEAVEATVASAASGGPSSTTTANRVADAQPATTSRSPSVRSTHRFRH